jgi:peroxiredoxin
MSRRLEELIAAAEGEAWHAFERGPTRLRWKRTPLQVGDAAPDLGLLDTGGKTRSLSEFWRDAPALLLFWRHYGCSCGRERAVRLIEEYQSYVDLGASVVVVGQGEPARAAAYAQRNKLPCQILCDPERRIYEAYDLLEGTASQILFDAGDDLIKCDITALRKLVESRSGTDRAIVDSPWQLPGEFVVDKKGTIRLAYRYQYCEDWPNPLVLVAALKEAIWETE